MTRTRRTPTQHYAAAAPGSFDDLVWVSKPVIVSFGRGAFPTNGRTGPERGLTLLCNLPVNETCSWQEHRHEGRNEGTGVYGFVSVYTDADRKL